MKRTSLMRKTPLARGDKPLKADPETTRQWRERSNATAAAKERERPRRQISPASPAQRKKVEFAPCVRCEKPGPCHPAHLIDRSIGGDDDPRAVVPLCFECHRLYDDGKIDLLPKLEPHYRDELAYAVKLVGLVAAINRITNLRWVPEREAA